MKSNSTFQAVDVVNRGTVFDHIGVNRHTGDETYPFAIAPNMIRTPRGGMLACWTAGAYEIAPNAVIMGRETYDGGKTWTYDSFIVAGRADHGLINCSFVRDEERMFLFYNDYRGRVRSAHGYFLDGTEDVWVAASEDTGAVWGDPHRITDFADTDQPYSLQVRANGIRLSSGELIVPVGLSTRDFPPVRSGQYRQGFGVVRSTDGGKSWQCHVHEVNDPNRRFEEPAVIECGDGSLRVYLRTGFGTIWQSRSEDRGETWSTPTDTGIVAASASVALAKLPDGRWVLAWNDHPKKRTFLSVAVSVDEGETWLGPDVIDMVCIEPMSPMRHEQVANVGLTIDDEGYVWMTWAHIARYDDGAYGSIKYARLRVRD